MSDKNFLKHFITEPVYVIPGEQHPSATTLEPEQKTATEIPVNREEEAVKRATKGIIIQEKRPEIIQEEKLLYKGSNSKKIAVLVDYPEEEFIAPADEAFLRKILGAIQLKIEESALMNIQKNPSLTKEMLLNFDAEKYLMFGVSPDQWFESVSLYEALSIKTNKQMLPCGTLAAIASDPTQKKLLWSALQKMFL